MPRRIDNRRDVLLLLLYSPGVGDQVNEPIIGKTRLTKMVFLFKKEAWPHFSKNISISNDKFYDFFAWNFGPFSKEVYDDLVFFQNRGFIEASVADERPLPESAAEWSLWLRFLDDTSSDDAVEYQEEQFALSKDKGIPFAASLYESLTPNQQEFLRVFKRKLQRSPLRAILQYVYSEYPEMASRSTILDKVLK